MWSVQYHYDLCIKFRIPKDRLGISQSDEECFPVPVCDIENSSYPFSYENPDVRLLNGSSVQYIRVIIHEIGFQSQQTCNQRKLSFSLRPLFGVTILILRTRRSCTIDLDRKILC